MSVNHAIMLIIDDWCGIHLDSQQDKTVLVSKKENCTYYRETDDMHLNTI
jgi:hypothetical protein